MTDPITGLICCSCGAAVVGRQWHYRYDGFGICARCIDRNRAGKRASEVAIHRDFGAEGVHFNVEGQTQPPYVPRRLSHWRPAS